MSVRLIDYSYEELANALYTKGKLDGYNKITDKTKWREPVMAEKLGHVAHKKISAGKGKDEYGSDAYDSKKSIFSEYKTKAIVEKELKNLFEEEKTFKNGKTKKFTPLKVTGVYNGFNSNFEVASKKYAEIDHYIGVFFEELCVLIIKVNTDYVMNTLISNYHKFVEKGKKGSTNLNSVDVNLRDTHLYEVAYKKELFFAN